MASAPTACRSGQALLRPSAAIELGLEGAIAHFDRLVALAINLSFAANVFLAGAGRVALETMAPAFTVSLALAWTFRAAAEQSYSAFALAGSRPSSRMEPRTRSRSAG